MREKRMVFHALRRPGAFHGARRVGRGETLRMFFLVMLCCVFSACTGGPRPANQLNKDAPVKFQGESPPLQAEMRLGPGDVINAVFLSKPLASGEVYHLQVGDSLLLEFHGAEHLNRNLAVRPDGMITVPYLGDVMAGGKTTRGVSEEISRMFKAKGLFPSVAVTLSVVSSNVLYRGLQDALVNSESGRGKDVAVGSDGLLRLPLIHPLEAAGRTMTELQSEADKVYTAMFPTSSVLLTLKRMDSSFVYVLGEVNTPGLVKLNARATVSQVLAMAGGFKETSGLSSVVLMHPDEHNQPTGRLVDVSAILSSGDLSKDVLVSRYDVIYVPPSFVHQLNQVILYGIRRMLPLESTASMSGGWSYVYQRTVTSGSGVTF